MIDFDKINQEALLQIDVVLSEILPGGKTDGKEYTVLNPTRSDKAPGSFKINLKTGAWGDFAVGDKGGDIISLWAYITGKKQSEAAKDLSHLLKLQGSHSNSPKKEALRSEKKPLPSKSLKDDDWKIVMPIPKGVTEPRLNHSRYGRHSDRWNYLDKEGNLLGIMLRFDIEDGKEFFPVTYWQKGDKFKWQWKTFPKPRSLFNLQTLNQENSDTILIVEGEKCAKIGAKTLNTPVLTWSGGNYGVNFADFSVLKKKKILLWSDNDVPGRKAMIEVYKILKKNNKTIRFIDFPEGKFKKGWDIYDAINGGWTEKDIYDKKELLTFEQFTVKYQKLFYSDEIFKDAPFRIAGHQKNINFYIPDDAMQIISLPAAHHNKMNLMFLAKLSWWDKNFKCGKAIDWTSAADALFQASKRYGIFNPFLVRGAGAWWDEGRIVLHLGNRLLCEGKEYGLTDFNTKYIYELNLPMDEEKADPLDKNSAYKFVELLDLLAWDKPIYAKLLAGWCVLSTISGTLKWRPHVWITGKSGTGKTWIGKEIIRPFLGDNALIIEAGTTAAAVRQMLSHKIVPVLYDEGEMNRQQSKEMMSQVFELMRVSSSEKSGYIAKGSATGGDPSLFIVRSCFCVISVIVGIKTAADISRTTVLSLSKHVIQPVKKFDEIEAKTLELLTKEFCASFRRRAFNMIPVIRQNHEIFAKAIALKMKERRLGDQLGGLLAGAFSLTSDEVISQKDAEAWIETQEWEEEKNVIGEEDEIQCLNHILQSIVDVEIRGRRHTRQIVHLVGIAAGISECEKVETEVEKEDAAKAIRQSGMGLDQNRTMLYISNNHLGIKKLLRDTIYVNSWSRVLIRIEGAKEKVCYFGPGVRSRAVGIWLSTIFDDIPEEIE